MKCNSSQAIVAASEGKDLRSLASDNEVADVSAEQEGYYSPRTNTATLVVLCWIP